MSKKFQNQQTIKLQIGGMTCGSCELNLERKFKKIPGILHANVSCKKGTATLFIDEQSPSSLETLHQAVREAGYRIETSFSTEQPISSKENKWLEILGSLIIIFLIYKIFQGSDLVSYASSSAGVSTFAGILIIGLVAGTSSCLAVTGGLLLSMAAKYNEVNQSATKWQKFKLLLMFNIGRLVSYFLLGGLVGVIGQSITLSTRITGYMNIVIALVMFFLALSILKVVPKASFPLRPPKWLSHKIADLSEHEHPAAPFALGALTFFLPCGFTQSLQFVALASGSFLTGGLTMFLFALGTLPALLGISIISSTAEGRTSRLFLRFSGALVLVLSIFNLNSGLLLTGIDISNAFSSSGAEEQTESNVTEENGVQIIDMEVSAYGYSPSSFTIEAGKPTLIRANADSNIGGCTSVLTVPEFDLSKYLRPGENELGPIENPTDDFTITCSMGMVSAAVNVVEGSSVPTSKVSVSNEPEIPENAQVVEFQWTYSGFTPSVLAIQKGIPTIVSISAEAPTGGCMSTVVFPNFDQSGFVPSPGEEPLLLALDTESAKSGDYPITCGMGIEMATLRIQ